MNNSIQKKLLSISKELMELPVGKCKHFSFIILNKKIVSIGWNNYYKTHPDAKKYKYRFDSIHSELAAVLKFKHTKIKPGRCIFVNTRVNIFGQFGMAKPCNLCEKWLTVYGFDEIWYTDEKGIFVKLDY